MSCILRDCRVLVLEDEYMLAVELVAELTQVGARVLGPASTIDDAIAIIHSEPRIDGAILDASLRGEMVFPVADLLLKRGVAFVFNTGYDASVFPARFSHVVQCRKPIEIQSLTQALNRAMRP